jgi:hypothetical protein
MKRQLSIRELRVLAAEDDVDQLQCAICMQVLQDALTCREGHMFCRACITAWLEQNQCCPTDRKELAPRDLGVPPLF